MGKRPSIIGQVVAFRNTLGGFHPYALGSNNIGQVVGYSYFNAAAAASGSYHATLWNGSAPIDLRELSAGTPVLPMASTMPDRW